MAPHNNNRELEQSRGGRLENVLKVSLYGCIYIQWNDLEIIFTFISTFQQFTRGGLE